MSTSFFLVPGAERSQHDSFSDQTSSSSSVLLQKQHHCNTFVVHAATVRAGGQQLLQEFHSSTLLQTCFTPTLIKMQHHPTATSLTRSTNCHSVCLYLEELMKDPFQSGIDALVGWVVFFCFSNGAFLLRPRHIIVAKVAS